MNRGYALPAFVVTAILGLAPTVDGVHAAEGDENEARDMSRDAEGAVRDAWLDGKLESALLFNTHLNSFTIDTDVRSGVAYLSGSVESDIDKDLAGEIARSIDGVTDVRNELVVDQAQVKAARAGKSNSKDQSFRKAVADATHTARVKTSLIANTNTSGLGINVDTSDGVVTLSGKVESSEEKALAEQIARNAEGTRSVDNKLSVVAQN